MIKSSKAKNIEFFPLKKEFISASVFKSIKNASRKRQNIFEQFVKFVSNQSKSIRDNCTKLKDHDYLVFNGYIKNAFDMINQCWSNQMMIVCDQAVKSIQDFVHNPQFQQSLPLESIEYESNKFQTLQQQLFLNIKQQQNQINTFLDTAKNYGSQRQKTLNYFNPNYFKQPYQKLNKIFLLIVDSHNKNLKLINKLEKKKTKFLTVFTNFRNIASKNRIIYEQKFHKASMMTINFLIKTFLILFKKIKKVKQILKNEEEFNVIVESNKCSSQNIFSICVCVKAISDMINNTIKQSNQLTIKFLQKIKNITKMEDSIPSSLINFVIETFQKVLSRYGQISRNLRYKVKLLQFEQFKLNDATSTNASCVNIQSGIRKPSNIKNSLISHKVIDEIIDQIIVSISKLITWTQTILLKDLNIYLNVQCFTLIKVNFNDEQILIHQQDKWMFENEKASNSIKVPHLKIVKQQLNKIKVIIENQKKSEGKQIMEPQKCHLYISQSYSIKGVLFTYQHCVKFVSVDGSILNISYQQITHTKSKLQTFKFNLFIYTAKGKICILNPPRIIKCRRKISERIKSSRKSIIVQDQMNNNNDQIKVGSTNKWKSVQLTKHQMFEIQIRKYKILNQLPNTTNWTQIHTPHTFKNIGIDQFFYEFFNDNSKQIGGKIWDSFNVYLLNILGGNSKIENGKFNSKGPKFYIQQGVQSFSTCSSFSERINTYQHTLQNFPIPFLPKFCKCKQVTKIYWISHQQFAYCLDAYSSGMPMTDSFYVRIVQHAKKRGNDILMTYRVQVVFTKDTSFKNILQMKCLQQIRDNLSKTIKVQQNRLKSVTKSLNSQFQIEQQQQTINSPTKELAINKKKRQQLNGSVFLFVVIIFLIIIKVMKAISN